MEAVAQIVKCFQWWETWCMLQGMYSCSVPGEATMVERMCRQSGLEAVVGVSRMGQCK